MKTVLVVDDKEMMRDSVCATLERAGFSITPAPDGAAALDMLAKRRPDCIVTDMRMPAMTGIELLEKVRAIDEDVPVILMTAFGTIETAVKAMKMGAFDYLTKPFEGDELIIAVKRAMEHRRLVRENAVLRTAAADAAALGGSPDAATPPGVNPRPRTGFDRLIGSSRVMVKLREQLDAIAHSQGTVLITGESGVGKEVVARAIHEASSRKDGAFVGVNCAALSPALLESELFGHERGAFTGADRLRKGRFELADGGTLLLDEVSEVAATIQAKLLRVLQERGFERVGSSLTIGVDTRVIATSNRDLPASVAKNEFRQDLYFRLNVLPVAVPPLRERADDIAELTEHFVREVCRREGREAMTVDDGAVDQLRRYSWPGNVRELQNICERAVVLSAGRGSGVITAELVEPWLASGAKAWGGSTGMPSAAAQQIETKPNGVATSFGDPRVFNGGSAVSDETGGRGLEIRPLEDIEREAIVHTLLLYKGHRQKTAAALGIGVRTLGLKIKQWKKDRKVAESL